MRLSPPPRQMTEQKESQLLSANGIPGLQAFSRCNGGALRLRQAFLERGGYWLEDGREWFRRLARLEEVRKTDGQDRKGYTLPFQLKLESRAETRFFRFEVKTRDFFRLFRLEAK
jgi:hypothetical protein